MLKTILSTVAFTLKFVRSIYDGIGSVGRAVNRIESTVNANTLTLEQLQQAVEEIRSTLHPSRATKLNLVAGPVQEQPAAQK